MLSEKSFPAPVGRLTFCLATFSVALTGCGRSEPSEETAVATSQPAAHDASATGLSETPAVAARKARARDEVWEDEKGQKWFGNVPMDVFFDRPDEVAANTTAIGNQPVAVAQSEAPMPAEGEKPADAPVKVESPPTEATPVAEKTAMAVVSDAPEADGWESLIPTTILEEEVKSIRNFLQETVNSVGNYNSSMMMIPPKVATLAALAEVARQQKESVSWKADANYVRDLAGKMNSSPLQRGAKDQKRLQELFESIADILNRSKPAGLEAPPETDSFAETAEMRSLMKRMEEAEKLMKTEIASADALGSRKAMVAHEASVLGVLAKIVTQPGYGYEEDAEFKGYANGIVQATQNLKNASEGGDFSGFEAAMSGIATNCQNCHSKYKND
jgi:cytochrome c556